MWSRVLLMWCDPQRQLGRPCFRAVLAWLRGGLVVWVCCEDRIGREYHPRGWARSGCACTCSLLCLAGAVFGIALGQLGLSQKGNKQALYERLDGARNGRTDGLKARPSRRSSAKGKEGDGGGKGGHDGGRKGGEEGGHVPL